MEKFIGTKEVTAEVVSLGYFIEKTGRNPYQGNPEMHSNEETGYFIVYPDGYQSWCSKEAFEKYYKRSETHIDRMIIERNELGDKLSKCSSFIKSEKFLPIVGSKYQAAMLIAQHGAMRAYYDALSNRLFGEDAEEVSFGFGTAIELLNAGFSVRRDGWNGKGLFVVKQIPARITEGIIPSMQSLPQSAKDIIMARENKVINYTNQMLIINPDGRADSWVPSVSDIFATDWELALI